MRLRPTLAAATLLLGLTACGSTEEAPATTSTANVEATPAPGLTPDDIDALTRTTFDLTWSEASEVERNAYCMSVAILPPDQAADEMRAGAGGSNELDWAYMVELLDAECALR